MLTVDQEYHGVKTCTWSPHSLMGNRLQRLKWTRFLAMQRTT